MENRWLSRKLKHMKKTLLLITFLSIQTLVAQKYITRSGSTSFKASVETFEPIEAINKSSSAIITQNGDFAALLLIKAFHFKVAFMQEHFNENYMDSDKYPKATFKGKINNFSLDKLKSNSQFTLEGLLTIKGRQKKIHTKATLLLKDEKILLKTKFSITPKEFDIKIPSIVRNKIAKNILLTINYELSKK